MKKILITLFIFLFGFTLQALPANITDFGAVPNDGISDADAIRAALRSVEQACGGEIIIPKGEFLLDESITTDFHGGCGYIHLAIKGETGAEIRVSVGAGNTALVMNTLKSLAIDHIVFLGVDVPFSDPLFTDAGTVIEAHTIETVVLDYVFFYGIAVDKAIIRTFNSNLRVFNSQFSGSAAYYPEGTYILGDHDISGNAWQSIKIENCQFLDYANYKRDYLNKTPYFMTGSYVRTKAPSPYGAAMTRGRLEIRDTIFDEGSHTAVTATDTPYVDLKGISINMNNTTNATGIRLTNVKYAVIDQSVADWQPGYFLTTYYVDYIKVNALTFKAGSAIWKNLGKTTMVIDYCPVCVLNPPPTGANKKPGTK
jgi:hypothetical protein